MRCCKCGTELDLGKDTIKLTRCPNCGKFIILETAEEVSFEEVLKEIIDIFGIKIIQNPERLIAIFMDVAPRLRDERIILEAALNLGVGSYFINCPIEERKRNVIRAKQVIDCLNDASKKLIISAFIKALQWDEIELKYIFKEVKLQKTIKGENNNITASQQIINSKADVAELYQAGQQFYNEKKYVKALEYLRKAAQLGSVQAQNYLGWMYVNGYGVVQNYVESLRWYKEAAGAGDSNAMDWVAFLYYMGNGVQQNYITALEWWKKGADAGNSNCAWWIGELFKEGKGVKQNYTVALKWYKKAADLGSGKAMDEIASFYYQGNGVQKNYTTAFEWWKKGADVGNAHCTYWVGELYKKGQGVKKDYSEAAKWYRKAAKMGDADAQKILVVLEKNNDENNSVNKFVNWYRNTTFDLDDLWLFFCLVVAIISCIFFGIIEPLFFKP